MKKFLRNLRYVLVHKWHVFVECCKLGVPLRGLLHDLSKFRPTEFFPYMEHFFGDPKSNKGKFKAAWNSHINMNPHHWQYWVTINGATDGPEMIPLPIPMPYLKEMLADWKGVAKTLKTRGIEEWYTKNRDKMLIHHESRKWLDEQIGYKEGIK